MVSVYVVWYIHTDVAEYSEILGVYKGKEEAVEELLERANFRERNGVLTQYMRPIEGSFSDLREKVMTDMELVDCDIYRITELPLHMYGRA